MKTPKKPQYSSIGSISNGTLRPEDLLPAMIGAADSLVLSKDERKTVNRIKSRVERAGVDDAYWTDEQADYDRDSLDSVLNNHALPSCFFGSHPGDGADIGFWLSEDALQDFDGLKVSDLSEIPAGYIGEVLHVNEHGNTSLYAATRGRLREVWAVV
jgi:hypothetical protein